MNRPLPTPDDALRAELADLYAPTRRLHRDGWLVRRARRRATSTQRAWLDAILSAPTVTPDDEVGGHAVALLDRLGVLDDAHRRLGTPLPGPTRRIA